MWLMANLWVWGQAPRRAAGTQRLWWARGRQEGPQGQEAPHHLPPSPPLSLEHAGGLAAAQGLPPAQGELSPSAQAGCEVPRRCQQHTQALSRLHWAGSTRSRQGSGFACGGRGRNFANPITSLPSSLTEHGIDFPHWVYLDCLFCEKAKLGRLTVVPGLMRKTLSEAAALPSARALPAGNWAFSAVPAADLPCTQPAQPSHSLYTACTARLALARVTAYSEAAPGARGSAFPECAGEGTGGFGWEARLPSNSKLPHWKPVLIVVAASAARTICLCTLWQTWQSLTGP